jgi:hypothetical protein
MPADPDAVSYIESSDTPVRVLLKPFTAEDLYHAVRDAITRTTDLAAAAEPEIVRAHAGLGKLASTIQASRTVRVQILDLVVAARELRRAARGRAAPVIPTPSLVQRTLNQRPKRLGHLTHQVLRQKRLRQKLGPA